MMLTLQKFILYWKKDKCIMTGKNNVERNVSKNEFPNYQMLICISHSLKSQEITTEKMKITSGGQNILEL